MLPVRDGHTISAVPGGVAVCLVVTVLYPEGRPPVQESSPEGHRLAYQEIKDRIPKLLSWPWI